MGSWHPGVGIGIGYRNRGAISQTVLGIAIALVPIGEKRIPGGRTPKTFSRKKGRDNMATARPTAASVPSVRRLREQILKEQKSLLLYEEVGSLSFFRRLPGDWQALSPAPGSGSDSDADPNTDATPKSGSTQTRAMREYVESNATQLLGETTGTPEEAG